MAPSSGEPSVTRKQSSAEFFRQHYVGRVISGKIVTELPNPGQQYEMGIPRDAEVEQVLNRLMGASCWNRSFVSLRQTCVT
jgi:hypothetical protein